ncbi:multicopper oxidase domain-containing protein, partial [Streptococcus pneumoniae]|nr:multicopper oxidase domain-containing protein [Streptococcus pneumoniae]
VAGEPIEMGLPTTLPTPFTHIEESEITNRRTLTFDVGPSSAEQPVATFKINDQMFSDERVDQYVELGSVEEWTIHNTSDEDHPFHIHVNDFEVV